MTWPAWLSPYVLFVRGVFGAAIVLGILGATALLHGLRELRAIEREARRSR